MSRYPKHKYLSDRDQCYFCTMKESLNRKKGCRRLIEEHHIIERHEGGSNEACNRVPACSNCHSRIHLEEISIDKYYNVGYTFKLKWKDEVTGEEFFGRYIDKYTNT